MPYCAFTSSTSTWDAQSFADCSKHRGCLAWLRCDCCIGKQQLDRCTECFHKFQTTLKRRLPLIEQQLKANVELRPEIEALLTIDFKELARGVDRLGHFELVSEVPLVWRWKPGSTFQHVPRARDRRPCR